MFSFAVHSQQGNLIFHEGLLKPAVNSITQDKDGFLWFGTWDVLDKFDGYDFLQLGTGFDNQNPTINNLIRYLLTQTKLPSGEYIFQVTASNDDGIWYKKGQSLQIEITPPFYRKLWFKIVISVLLAFLIIFLFYKRIAELRNERDAIKQKAEKDIISERNQLRTLIDNIPDFIYIKDRNSRFIVANKHLARVMGGQVPDDLIGKTDKQFYPPEFANKFYQDEQEIIQSKKPLINHVEPGLDQNGNRKYVSTTKIPLKDDNGEVIGIVGIGRDVTHIKETERKLMEQAENLQEVNVLLEERQEEIQQQSEEVKSQAENLKIVNEELEKLNATKDKFFSIIAHDLKNPFHAISGFSELLSSNFNQMSDEEKLELVELINISSETAYNLLENLLQWARTQTDKINYQPDNLQMNEILDQNIEFLKASAKKKSINLFSELNSDLKVYADKNMVNTILRNLISNAIKFTNNNGEIKVSNEELTRHVQITVEDTGIGINQKDLEKLFKLEEFHTTSGTSGESGTGLGLIICKEFVEKNGGSIRVESIPGKGSKFIFTLPKSSEKRKTTVV